MRCPECNALNESGAAACATCGLLLANLQRPRRRRDDFAAFFKRRSSDSQGTCPYCRGEIEPDAVYCRHCQTILSEEYRLKTTRRLRANINYASWVAYVFGLISFLIFRPVGMISIGAGLILSIVYYALPELDRQPRSEKKGLSAVWPFLKAQFRLDRIAVPLPVLRKRRLVFVGTPLVAAVIGYFANFLFLQQPMNQVLQGHTTFDGIEVSAHYRYWVLPGQVVYNLQSVDARRAIDVHTVLLEYAKRLKDRRFKSVELQFRGERRFSIDGSTFQRVGREYDQRNFAYVLFDFPRLFRGTDSPEDSGSISDSEALLEFHDQWYARELRDKGAARSASTR